MNIAARLVGFVVYSQDPATKSVTAFLMDPAALNLPHHRPALAIQAQYVDGDSSPADQSIAIGDYDVLVWHLDGRRVDILDPQHASSQPGVTVDWEKAFDLGKLGLHVNPSYYNDPLSAPNCQGCIVMHTGTLTLSIQALGATEAPSHPNTGHLDASATAPLILVTSADGATSRIKLRDSALKNTISATVPTMWFSCMPRLGGQYDSGGSFEFVAIASLVDWGNVGGPNDLQASISARMKTLGPGLFTDWLKLNDPELVRCGRPTVYLPVA